MRRSKEKMRMLYIKAAERIIRNEGIKGLSIRALASEVGYNSATLYSYFEDLDELIMFTTFKFRKEYLVRLSREIIPEMSALEQYVKLYEIYCDFAFDEPEIFYNMYFSKYSYRLKAVLKEYYQMFPEEYIPQTPLVDDLLTAGDVYAGEAAALRYLVEEKSLREENVGMVANIVVRVHASYMWDLCVHPHQSITLARHQFMDCLLHILKTNC